MIGQAFGAEVFKLLRNKWSLFWAFGFMPVFALAAGLIEETLVRAYTGDMLPFANPILYAYDGLGLLQPSISQLFAIVGAAILFAGEYRWETWRAILPRNDRTAVLIAKLLLYALAAGASILACACARLLVGFYDAMLTGQADAPASSLLGLLTGFGGTFLQIMVTGALVMLVSVVSRSLLAAIVGPLVILVAVDLSAIRFRIETGELWLAALPNFAGRAIHESGLLLLGEPDAIGVHLAMPGAIAMMLWTALLAIVAIVVFQRQDLSRE
jgi:ABC-2 type transport system permease protein